MGSQNLTMIQVHNGKNYLYYFFKGPALDRHVQLDTFMFSALQMQSFCFSNVFTPVKILLQSIYSMVNHGESTNAGHISLVTVLNRNLEFHRLYTYLNLRKRCKNETKRNTPAPSIETLKIVMRGLSVSLHCIGFWIVHKYIK